MKRNLDGVYFRTEEADGTWGNTCFSDLSEEEQDEVMKGRSEEWLKSLCKILGSKIKEIGDEFDIVAD